MSEEKQLDANVFVVYSPDEGIFYLERRIPYSWATSQEFDTLFDAEESYQKDTVEWEEDDWQAPIGQDTKSR